MSLMFEALKACGRALANEKAGRARAGRGKATRGKAAVTFAARLTFEDVSRHYGATLGLDHVSLAIAPGEVPLTRREAKTEAHAAFERVGLAHYVSEYPHILSGGEQQRVALARAIAPRPSVLLMDEPFSGLDPRLREKIREETLAILHETRATCIVVTHDAEEAMRMGDRVALLRAGHVVQTGRALDLYRAPKDILAARAFSDLNEVPASIENGSARTVLGRFPARNLADGEDAIVCVRQRGVRLL